MCSANDLVGNEEHSVISDEDGVQLRLTNASLRTLAMTNPGRREPNHRSMLVLHSMTSSIAVFFGPSAVCPPEVIP